VGPATAASSDRTDDWLSYGPSAAPCCFPSGRQATSGRKSELVRREHAFPYEAQSASGRRRMSLPFFRVGRVSARHGFRRISVVSGGGSIAAINKS
jgi:hypothetical protein